MPAMTISHVTASTDTSAVPPFAAQMLATLPYPTLLLDAAGQVKDTNTAMAALLAMPHGQIVNRPLSELVEPTSRASCEHLLREAVAHPGVAQVGEIGLRAANGTTMLVRYNVLTLAETAPPLLLAIGQPLQEWLDLLQEVVALNGELAHRNRQLAQLNEQLHQAEQQREHVTNLLVHDIRSPLVATSASLEIVQRGLATVSAPSMLTEAVAAGLKSLRTVVELTNDLLEIKKLASGHRPAAIERIAIAPLCAEIQSTLQALAMERQAIIQLDVGPPDLAVNGDRRLLRRVLQNIVTNAIRFTPPGGAIRVQARPQGEREVFVVVADQGPGVAPEDRERIFQPFVQGAGESRRGSGLGLAFCREVVHAHGGRIWVEGRPGGGSRFCFTLPVEPV
jgi:signal transduction histidine kinase